MARPNLKVYGERLRRSVWAYDELSLIAEEWNIPASRDAEEAVFKGMCGFALTPEEENAIATQKAALEAWDRYVDYQYLRAYCDALADVNATQLAEASGYAGLVRVLTSEGYTLMDAMGVALDIIGDPSK